MEGDSTRDNSCFPKSETTFIFPCTKPSFLGEGNVKSRVLPGAPGSSIGGVSLCLGGPPGRGHGFGFRGTRHIHCWLPGMLGIRQQERRGACSVHGMGEKEGPDPTPEAPAPSWGVWEGENELLPHSSRHHRGHGRDLQCEDPQGCRSLPRDAGTTPGTQEPQLPPDAAAANSSPASWQRIPRIFSFPAPMEPLSSCSGCAGAGKSPG